MKRIDENDSPNREDWPLFRLYRIRNVAPGFAIPLFRGDDGAAYAQLTDEEGRISGFARVNISGSIVFDLPDTNRPCSARVGERPIYAFHKPDGRFAIGNRDDVEAAVREDLHNLRDSPFTWLEAARFVRDEEQVRLATIETDKLLRRPDQSCEFGSRVGGPT